MVEQTSPTTETMTLQAGPVELDDYGTLSDLTRRSWNGRDARTIGQQLAQIGDQLNQRWAHRLPNPWLLQPLDRRTSIFIRASVFRRFFVTEGRSLRDVFALGKLWLNPLVYNQPAWVSNLCPPGLRWMTGLLASAALLTTAVVCIALWELRMN